VKTKRAGIKYPEHKPSALVLNDAVALPAWGFSIPVRVAKAKLSALLELVAGGQKSRSPRTASRKRCCRRSANTRRGKFHRHLEQLKKMPMQTEDRSRRNQSAPTVTDAGGNEPWYLDPVSSYKLVTHEPDSAAYHGLVPATPSSLRNWPWRKCDPPASPRNGPGGFPARHASRLGGCFRTKCATGFLLLPLDRRVIERAGAVIDQCHPKVALRRWLRFHVATAQLHGASKCAAVTTGVIVGPHGLSLTRPPPKTNNF